MKCFKCKGAVRKVSGDYARETRQFGTVCVPDIQWEECSACGDRYLSPDQAIKVEDHIKLLVSKELGSRPFDDLLSAGTACEILGMSKQAFNQNRRIKRGFIYSKEKDGRLYYLRQSVEAFKEAGDGRIPLRVTSQAPTKESDSIAEIVTQALITGTPQTKRQLTQTYPLNLSSDEEVDDNDSVSPSIPSMSAWWIPDFIANESEQKVRGITSPTAQQQNLKLHAAGLAVVRLSTRRWSVKEFGASFGRSSREHFSVSDENTEHLSVPEILWKQNPAHSVPR